MPQEAAKQQDCTDRGSHGVGIISTRKAKSTTALFRRRHEPLVDTAMSIVRVKVPATTANVGPGFDLYIWGIALQIYNVVTVTKEAGWSGRHFRHGGGGTLLPESRRKNLSRCQWKVTGDVPRSRGMGSSVTVRRLGLLHRLERAFRRAARAPEEIFELCAELEGHPDNAATRPAFRRIHHCPSWVDAALSCEKSRSNSPCSFRTSKWPRRTPAGPCRRNSLSKMPCFLDQCLRHRGAFASPATMKKLRPGCFAVGIHQQTSRAPCAISFEGHCSAERSWRVGRLAERIGIDHCLRLSWRRSRKSARRCWQRAAIRGRVSSRLWADNHGVRISRS